MNSNSRNSRRLWRNRQDFNQCKLSRSSGMPTGETNRRNITLQMASSHQLTGLILLILVAISLNLDSITCAGHRHNENHSPPQQTVASSAPSATTTTTTTTTRHQVKKNHHISPQTTEITHNNHNHRNQHSTSPKRPASLQSNSKDRPTKGSRSSASKLASNKVIETTINAFDFDHSKSNMQLERILALAANAAAVSINQSAGEISNQSTTPAASSSSNPAAETRRENLMEREREREIERDSVTVMSNGNSTNTKPPVVDPRELVKSLRSINSLAAKGRKSFLAGYPVLDDHQHAIQQEIHQTFHDLDSPSILNSIPSIPMPMMNDTSNIDENGFAAAFEATEETPTIVRLRSPPSANDTNRLPLMLSHRAHLAEQHAILHDFEAPDHSGGENSDYGEAQTGGRYHSSGRQSLARSVDPYHPPTASLSPLSTYLPDESRSSGGLSTDGRPPNNIRVVFNNNPQFIIGRDAATGHLDTLPNGSSSRSRSPLSSGGRSIGSYHNDDYHGDESRIDETKVSQTNVQAPDGRSRPCDKDGQEKFEPNLEQIDLNQQIEMPPPSVKSLVPVQQVKQQIEPQAPIKQTKIVVQQPQQEFVQEPQFQQSKSPLDEQVITPFDQIVKSGIRPPLRMVISMRNKNGDVMKVPINLQGSAKQPPVVQQQQQQQQQQAQVPAIDLSPQMQIQFESPGMEKVAMPQLPVAQVPVQSIKQTQQQIQRPVDENTPIGGDVFDPSIVKPFTKTSTKTRKESPMSKLVSQLKSIALPQQLDDEDNDEQAPQVQEKTRPPQEPTKQSLPPVTMAPPLPIPQQQVMQEQQQQVQAPEPLPQVKTKPPVKQTPVIAPPIKTQKPVKAPTSPPIKQEPQVQLPEVQAPAKNPIKPITHLPDKGTKKTNCHEEEQQQQQQENTDADLPPISMNADGDGVVQMMMPKLTPLHNKTFASMFAQFQKALNEQMQVHQLISDAKNPQEQQQQRQEKQQQQDEQEDLMVAMMAANMNKDGQLMLDDNRRMTMTVIKPPKGTSIQEAIAAHARNSSDATRAVAILHSIRNKVKRPGDQMFPNQSGTGDQQPSPPVNLPPAHSVDISLRPGGNPLPANQPQNVPSTSEDPADPDGFSSEVSFSHQFQQQPQRQLQLNHQNQPQGSNMWSNEPRGRFKRSADSGELKLAGKHLEPSDKLTNSPSRPQENAGKQFLARRPKPEKQAPREERKRQPHELRKKPLEESERRRINESASNNIKYRDRSRGRDTIDAAASQQNEVSDDDEPEEDSEPSDSNADESSASPSSSGGSDGSDLMDDESNDMSDDSDDSSGFGDSDDEPYNQGASSERDYNSPTTFDIPQIDINPDTLKQKGCKTVLREVQEIPLNGLGVVRADGQPGSGYQDQEGAGSSMAGRRVRRQTNNENLINSRKVTSIVMTKECHFPNENQQPGEVSGAKKSLPTRAQVTQKRPQPNRQQQVVATALPPVSSSIGSTPSESSMLRRPQMPQILRPAMATNVVYHPQAQAAYATYKRIDPKLAANFYNIAPASHVHQPHFQMLSSAQTPSGQYLAPAVESVAASTAAAAAAATPTAKTTTNKQPPVRQIQVAIVQPMGGQVQQPQVSPIRRRSVVPTIMPVMSLRSRDARASGATKDGKPRGKDIYIGADSRRNEVVAKKLYKPPSEDDPYHTLSYSSQTGIDPDMDQDEDDSFVMGPDDQQESASSGNNQRRPRPESSRARPSGLRPPKMRETLSEDERMALMDPNHEDTDPVQPNGATSNRRNMNKRPVGSAKEKAERESSDDADESDADLADETRQREAKINNLSSQIRRRQDQLKAMRSPNSRMNSKTNYQATRLQQQPPASQLNHMRRTNLATGHNDNSRFGDSGNESGGNSEEEPQRFGRSFKFEHKVGRPEAHGLAAQLKGLRPGRQGFVSVMEGDEGRERVARLSSIPTSVKRPVGGVKSHSGTKGSGGGPALRPQMAARRQDDEASVDPDENDEGDDEEEETPNPRTSAAASSRRDVGSADSEDPDADPDYNPKESQIPAHTKPKKLQKSFAYVHRDLPKKGSKNPDDFVISYGKGDIQTEQEDYDSDREHQPNGQQADRRSDDQQPNQQAAAASTLSGAHRRVGAPQAPIRPTAHQAARAAQRLATSGRR